MQACSLFQEFHELKNATPCRRLPSLLVTVQRSRPLSRLVVSWPERSQQLARTPILPHFECACTSSPSPPPSTHTHTHTHNTGKNPPAVVFVAGCGVAGLEAIASCKKLGAIVRATDVRLDCVEQVASVGGEFVHPDIESLKNSQEEGG
jgi:hypothetical protein